jgi:hypothetical protein
MNNKPFDQALFDANDDRGRQAAIKALSGNGIAMIPSHDKYAVDLEMHLRGVLIAYVEVAISPQWKGIHFPFKSSHILYRKKKYLNLLCPTYFIIFNNECSHHMMICGSDIVKCKVIEVPNKYVPAGELSFDVPLSICKFMDD